MFNTSKYALESCGWEVCWIGAELAIHLHELEFELIFSTR